MIDPHKGVANLSMKSLFIICDIFLGFVTSPSSLDTNLKSFCSRSSVVQLVSQFVSEPRRPYLNDVHRIIHYLHGIVDKGLFYSSPLQITAYIDAKSHTVN